MSLYLLVPAGHWEKRRIKAVVPNLEVTSIFYIQSKIKQRPKTVGHLCKVTTLKTKAGTFVDVLLSEALNGTSHRNALRSAAPVELQLADWGVFGQDVPELQVVWVDVSTFQILLCDLRWWPWKSTEMSVIRFYFTFIWWLYLFDWILFFSDWKYKSCLNSLAETEKYSWNKNLNKP